jgi:hypothetical protein
MAEVCWFNPTPIHYWLFCAFLEEPNFILATPPLQALYVCVSCFFFGFLLASSSTNVKNFQCLQKASLTFLNSSQPESTNGDEELSTKVWVCCPAHLVLIATVPTSPDIPRVVHLKKSEASIGRDRAAVDMFVFLASLSSDLPSVRRVLIRGTIRVKKLGFLIANAFQE